MRYVWLLVVALIVIGLLVYQPGNRPAGPAYSGDSWESEVLHSKEPVLVDFWATWCGPCRRMEGPLESLGRDFKVVRVDVDRNTELAARYRIQAIPALLIFKDGQVAERFVGVTPEDTLRAALQRQGARPATGKKS